MDRWNLLFVAGTFASIFLPFIIVLSGKDWRGEQDKARERRIAEHKMNARLLNSTSDAFLDSPSAANPPVSEPPTPNA